MLGPLASDLLRVLVAIRLIAVLLWMLVVVVVVNVGGILMLTAAAKSATARTTAPTSNVQEKFLYFESS